MRWASLICNPQNAEETYNTRLIKPEPLKLKPNFVSLFISSNGMHCLSLKCVCELEDISIE